MESTLLPTKTRKDIIQEDIDNLWLAVEVGDFGFEYKNIKELHMAIDGKYQTCIKDWGKSMYGYDIVHGFSYNNLSDDAIKHNLRMMIAKLSAFIEGWNNANTETPTVNSPINVTVNNTVNLNVSVEEAKQKIDDMTSLSDKEVAEIKAKLDELEHISKEHISRRNKWEKVKPIISFALDKGADVAIAILSIVMQMHLGI